MAEDETVLGAVHRLLMELDETKGKMKSMRDNLKDVMLQNSEYQELQDEIKELTAKKQQAKKVLEADRDYQAINSELAELKFKHKDLLEIMSHHLVTYYNEGHETAIKDPEGEVRQLILNAKLGKPDVLAMDSPRPSSKKPLRGQVSIESQIEGYGK